MMKVVHVRLENAWNRFNSLINSINFLLDMTVYMVERGGGGLDRIVMIRILKPE